MHGVQHLELTVCRPCSSWIGCDSFMCPGCTTTVHTTPSKWRTQRNAMTHLGPFGHVGQTAFANIGEANAIFCLFVGNFVIIWTDNHTFIEEVLDIYKKGMSNHYASIE